MNLIGTTPLVRLQLLTADVIDRLIARTKELIGEPGTFWPDQVNNLDNKRGYHGMAREILGALDDLGTGIDEFVMAIGGGAASPATRRSARSGADGWSALQRARALGPGKANAASGSVSLSGSRRRSLLIVLGSWGPCGEVCLGDIDGDEEVGFDDLLILLDFVGSVRANETVRLPHCPPD